MYRRHVRARTRLYYQRARRFLLHRVLHADDPPHQLALAVAIGVFITITPTVGVQSILVVLVAWLLGANKLLGVPVLWISNPITIVPMYYGCYKVGVLLTQTDGVDPAWWQALADPPPGWIGGITFYWSRFTEVAVPMWVGCLVVAAIAGPISYVIAYRTIRFYRLRRWGQLVPPTAQPAGEPGTEKRWRAAGSEKRHAGAKAEDARPRIASSGRRGRTHSHTSSVS